MHTHTFMAGYSHRCFPYAYCFLIAVTKKFLYKRFVYHSHPPNSQKFLVLHLFNVVKRFVLKNVYNRLSMHIVQLGFSSFGVSWFQFFKRVFDLVFHGGLSLQTTYLLVLVLMVLAFHWLSSIL